MNRTAPQRTSVPLSLFDCASCNACLVACPNDAIFRVITEPGSLETWELVARAGSIEREPMTFAVERDEQWAVFADLCNACGNCEAFCPELGGPHRAKPRFHGSRESFAAASPADAVLIEDSGARMLARLDGALYELRCESGGFRFGDGVIEAVLDSSHRVRSAVALVAREGHRLSLLRYHAMRVLREAVLDRVNPVSTPFLGFSTPTNEGC